MGPYLILIGQISWLLIASGFLLVIVLTFILYRRQRRIRRFIHCQENIWLGPDGKYYRKYYSSVYGYDIRRGTSSEEYFQEIDIDGLYPFQKDEVSQEPNLEKSSSDKPAISTPPIEKKDETAVPGLDAVPAPSSTSVTEENIPNSDTGPDKLSDPKFNSGHPDNENVIIAQLDTGFTSHRKVIDEDDPFALLQSGYFHFDCPSQMVLGKEETVRASIFKSDLIYAFRENKASIDKIMVSKSMSVKLQGDSFKIVQENSMFQLITNYDETVWRWKVTPIKHGTKFLSLVVTVKLKVDGSEEYKDYEILDKEILIAVDRGYITKKWLEKNWQWVVSTIAGSGVVFSLLKAFSLIK